MTEQRTYEEGYIDGWLSVRRDPPAEVPRYRLAVGMSEYKFGVAMGADDARKADKTS